MFGHYTSGTDFVKGLLQLPLHRGCVCVEAGVDRAGEQ